jgi:large subunit ribosomal protein L10
MSKPVKALLRKELIKRLAGVDSLAVVSLAGVDGVASNLLRRQLRTKDIRVTVVKNSVAKAAFKEVGLDKAGDLLDGPCAVATGGTSVVAVVRELLEQHKTMPALIIRGALMEGEIFGEDRVEALSKYPTREEAQGQVVMLLRSPGSRLASCLVGPSGKLAGIIKAIKEKAEKAAPPEPPPAPAEASAPAPAEQAAPAAPAAPESPAPPAAQ